MSKMAVAFTALTAIAAPAGAVALCPEFAVNASNRESKGHAYDYKHRYFLYHFPLLSYLSKAQQTSSLVDRNSQ